MYYLLEVDAFINALGVLYTKHKHTHIHYMCVCYKHRLDWHYRTRLFIKATVSSLFFFTVILLNPLAIHIFHSLWFCRFIWELSTFVIVLCVFVSWSSTQSRNGFWYEKARKGDTFDHQQPSPPTHTHTHMLFPYLHLPHKQINRVYNSKKNKHLHPLLSHFFILVPFCWRFVSIFCPCFVHPHSLFFACIRSIGFLFIPNSNWMEIFHPKSESLAITKANAREEKNHAWHTVKKQKLQTTTIAEQTSAKPIERDSWVRKWRMGNTKWTHENPFKYSAKFRYTLKLQ